MNSIEIAESFYTHFKNKNFQGMQALYADQATFSDPVFQHLNAIETKMMWEMLCKQGKDLEISFGKVKETQTGTVQLEWIAYYTFGKKKRKIKNTIATEIRIKDGKIIQHKDQFDFEHWIEQALGIPRVLVKVFPFFKYQIRKQALKSLQNFQFKNTINQ